MATGTTGRRTSRSRQGCRSAAYEYNHGSEAATGDLSVAEDEERLVRRWSPHGGDVLQTFGVDPRFEFLRGVRFEDDLVGPHVDRDVLTRVPLEVPVAWHSSMMPSRGPSGVVVGLVDPVAAPLVNGR